MHRTPKKPSGSKGAQKPTRKADPLHAPQERRYAQMIRADRKEPSYETLAARANFWSNVQKTNAANAANEKEFRIAGLDQANTTVPIDTATTPPPFNGPQSPFPLP